MLKELITVDEKEMMDYYRRNYAFYSNAKPVTPLDTILTEWESAKIKLFQLFGNELIITKSIDYKRSTAELTKDIVDMKSSFITYGREGHTCREFVNNWINWVNSFFPYNVDNRLNIVLTDLVANNIGLASNSYQGNTIEVPMPNGKIYKITQGTKVLRALGKISEAYHIEGFEDFRICHSLILNNKIAKGTLTLSIHPLDYWTMSDNDCGWTSCMNWQEQGSYRQGTIEMMNSSCIIVAYLSVKTPMTIGNNQWSNKRWRQLFIVNKNLIMGIKSYPSENEILTKEILNWLADLASTNLGWTYEPELGYYEKGKITCAGNTKYTHFYTKLMYNDITSGWNAPIPSYINGTFLKDPETYILDYSGKSQCVSCGKELGDWAIGASLCCRECDSVAVCDNCGGLTLNDEIYIVGDSTLCHYCYHEETGRCDCCEEDFWLEDLNSIYIAVGADDKAAYVSNDTVSFCTECYNRLHSQIPIFNEGTLITLQDLKAVEPDLVPFSLNLSLIHI